MNSHDFNIYTKVSDMKGYDGFIGPNGEFYRVKKTNYEYIDITHYTWAEEYAKNNIELQKFLANSSISTIYLIATLKSKLNILIHGLGFVYYSHEHTVFSPITIFPDKNFNNKTVTKEQLDTLFDVMTINNEKPLESEAFLKAYQDDTLIDSYRKLF